MIYNAIDISSTCMGEYGIGYGKIKYLEMQYGKRAVDLMRNIKKSIDPLNIMNPGKVVSLK